MRRTAETSPYYDAWVRGVDGDLGRRARRHRRAAICAALGAVAERSAMRMHASAMAADPPILYWNPRDHRGDGRGPRAARRAERSAFFTFDAGPHVKVLCDARDAETVAAALAEMPGVLRTLDRGAGTGRARSRRSA